jgi:hypothetical protein
MVSFRAAQKGFASLMITSRPEKGLPCPIAMASLPPRERRKFFAHVHELEKASQALPHSKPKRRIRWPDAAARRSRIFGDKVLPNLVLLARERERY